MTNLDKARTEFFAHLNAYHQHGKDGRITAAHKEHRKASAIYSRLVNAAWQPGHRPQELISEMCEALENALN